MSAERGLLPIWKLCISGETLEVLGSIDVLNNTRVIDFDSDHMLGIVVDDSACALITIKVSQCVKVVPMEYHWMASLA